MVMTCIADSNPSIGSLVPREYDFIEEGSTSIYPTLTRRENASERARWTVGSNYEFDIEENRG